MHAANSAAALGYPEARRGMVRVACRSTGTCPTRGWVRRWRRPASDSCRRWRFGPTSSAVRQIEVGERPSYRRLRAVNEVATIATVPFGYADGYPRRLFDAGAEVLINGRRYPLAGMVTMDMLVIDCGDDAVKPVDEVVLLGRQGDEEITADEWATRAGTISWEILCGIGARVPRILVD